MKQIELTKGLFALVDDSDYELVNSLNWYAWKHHQGYFYAFRNWGWRETKRKNVMAMHHFLIGHPLKGLVVDHINGNTLDNRRSNLRFVSSRENSQNRHYHRSGKLIGSTFDPRRNAWNSRIYLNGVKTYLGAFKTEEEAHKKYLETLRAFESKEVDLQSV